MSALRRIVAWLGTALWLRWRLAAAKARRIFGGRPPAAGAGPGLQLAPAEIPVEGIDYDEGELPAELLARLEDVRAELLETAGRRAVRPPRRRVPRRSVALATAALATLGVAAGATALVTGTTGVPEVDRLLGIYEAELDEPQVPEVPGVGGGDLQPRPERGIASVELPVGDGPQRVVGTFYVARDGNVCAALTERPDSSPQSIGCVPPARVRERGARDGGLLMTVATRAGGVAIAGLVSDRVTEIGGRGPNGALDVRLGERWTPGPVDVAPLEPFVALGEADDAQQDGLGALDSREDYVFEAVTDDGERIRITR